MNRLVIFIVILLGLISCGAQKIVASQEVQTDAQIQTYDSVSLNEQLKKLVRQALAENIKSMTSQDAVIETTTYSVPDSTGTQYVLLKQIAKITTKAEESKSLIVESTIEETEIVDSTSISASIEDLVLESSTDIEEKQGLPWWQMTLLLIGAAVLIMIILRIVFKFL